MEAGSALLPLPQGLCIIAIEKEEATLLIHVRSTRKTACCPLCAAESDAVHSRYQRRLSDLPCTGQPVCLRLIVRKFFCKNPLCARKIFTERLPAFVEPWAQTTLRLKEARAALGFATSGRLGARLGARLGITTSWMTILRGVMAFQGASPHPVTALGVDDFSFKRGRRFGTILVDLSTHQVIDLLPERSSESAAAWMRGQPALRYVSRDRGQDYTIACREGAPQAVAIADRFHIMKNFVEALSPEISRCYKQLRQTQKEPALDSVRQAPDAEREQKRVQRQAHKAERFEQVKALISQGVSPKEVASQLGIPERTVYHWRGREDCPVHRPEPKERTERLKRFEQAKTLRSQGMTPQEIAQHLGVAVRTVQYWLARESAPHSQPRRKPPSLFDAFVPSVFSRFSQGCRDIPLIYTEIQQQGYRGSIRTLYRFMHSRRVPSLSLPTPSVFDQISVHKATWLIARPDEHLEADERTDLRVLCEACSDLAALHTLAQFFGQIVRKREGHRLDEWMQRVKESHFRDLKRFATSLQRDQKEILAGLTLVYSNGQVEGFVNKLKLIKRQGYGRASFPLLRQRVLYAL